MIDDWVSNNDDTCMLACVVYTRHNMRLVSKGLTQSHRSSWTHLPLFLLCSYSYTSALKRRTNWVHTQFQNKCHICRMTTQGEKLNTFSRFVNTSAIKTWLIPLYLCICICGSFMTIRSQKLMTYIKAIFLLTSSS